MSDPAGAALAITDAVPLGVSVVLLGGLAANAYRPIQRLTVDADLLIVGGIRSAGAITRELVENGFQHPPGKRVYRVGRFEWRRLLWPHPDPMTPSVVDLFFTDEGIMGDVAKRARPRRVFGRDILVASPEDIIVLKCLAIGSGTRGHKVLTDKDDVWSILHALGKDLDVIYIRRQASAVGVLRAANKFLSEARL